MPDYVKTATAKAKYVRISPRKVQIVCELIKGQPTKNAEAILRSTPKAASEPLLKLLKSACANAENNHDMDEDELIVSDCYATAGPILKRGQPRAHGRMYRINKRTSHITLTVVERE